MTSLLDTGLQALVAPREDGGGGGVGLVLGALAAVAGLAVLGAIEDARAEIDALPLFQFNHRAYNKARRLACEPEETIHDIGFGSLHEPDFDLLAELGWKDEQGVRIPTDPEERLILADQLMMRGDSRGELMALLLANAEAPCMQAFRNHLGEPVGIVRNYHKLEYLKDLDGEGDMLELLEGDDGLRAAMERCLTAVGAEPADYRLSTWEVLSGEQGPSRQPSLFLFFRRNADDPA